MLILQDIKITAILVLMLLAAAPMVAGCASGESGRVDIVPENDCWSPAMSSVIGIGLSANYTGNKETIYEWSADYGGFLLWTPEIVKCAGCEGCPCITGETVWWTYITEGDTLPAGLPGEVCITVKAKDIESGDIIAESTINLIETEGGGYCTGA